MRGMQSAHLTGWFKASLMAKCKPNGASAPLGAPSAAVPLRHSDLATCTIALSARAPYLLLVPHVILLCAAGHARAITHNVPVPRSGIKATYF